MSGFIRRYTSDPGNEVLLSIEGIVIIDREQPAALSGLGSGVVTVVGEFEDGAFDTPTEITSNTDLINNFGDFGFTYDGIPFNNCCARARKADGQLLPEYWNGNGFVAVVNKKFRRLIVARVDTSVGQVTFTRQASIVGNDKFEWDLEPAQVLALDIGAGSVSATFSAAATTKDSSAGTFPTTFAGGEKMTITVDSGTAQQIGPIDVYFTAADTNQALSVARINAAMGFTLATVQGGGVTRLTGRVRGTSGNVQVNSQDAIVATALGFNTTIANGTGNVANIDKVTFAEVKSIVEAAVAGTTVDRDSNGKLRVRANAAATIVATVTTTADDLGFAEAVSGSAATGVDGFIPAGTRVRNGSAVEWVTCQTLVVTASSAGPYTVKVRPAVDDGTNAGATAGTVTTIPAAIPAGAFSVTNTLPLTAALTESQIDAAYARTIDSTLSQNAISRETNIIVSARASNSIRQKLRSNALTASSQGLRGRITVVRPPLNTSRTVAKSTTTQPGVGAYRSENVVYAYPGLRTNVPQIATRGTAGGAGFTADGNIDVGADTWTASIMSQLNPEENPGQLTAFAAGAFGLEAGNSDIQSMTIDDYVAFRLTGIAAFRFDDGNLIIQSGVTSVDPTTEAGKRNIARRRFSYFVQDSVAVGIKNFSKKLATKARRAEVLGIVDAFMRGLLSENNADNQRIDSYSLDAKSANTPESLALGLFRIRGKVRMLPSMDVIVFETQIGENVDATVAEV